MPLKTAEAVWNGSLIDGKGQIKSPGGISTAYGWKSRAEGDPGISPEELIAAAHAGCFSMALSHMLSTAGHVPTRIRTTADVRFDKVDGGFAITRITLKTEGQVPGIDEATFRQHAEKAKTGCPVSKALASVPMDLEVRFVK
jgi:osmotically inducible protein OsmC